jgi:hypothetical protein
MHRAALAAARARDFAVNLGHHFADIDALGDAVAVPAMGRRDAVLVVEMHHDAGRGGFLAGVKVHETRDFAAAEIDVQPFFELADGFHRAVSLE